MAPAELAQRIIDGQGFKFRDLSDYRPDDLSEAIRLLGHYTERIRLEAKFLTQERDRTKEFSSR
jgi:hypothetical protein